MAAFLIRLFLILSSLLTLTSQNQHHEIAEAKLKISRLESIMEESLQKLDARSNYIKVRDNLIDELAIKIQDLQSLLSNIKHDLSHNEERVAALEEEVRLLWAVSRQNNFDLHILQSKAQDAEDRLEEVTSQVEKMADFVNEQWIQIQHLEQALHMTEMRAHNAQRKLRVTKCTFLKLQGLIKQKMEKNELTAALVNEELIFFVASALITFPVLTAWMLLSSKFS
ncbi:uncharacterized protein LOC123218056 isoform X2 [Mangifera indica]|uniref:uncharacterized protein LOC123218056 isoform X2 n=1 Tax=Mangifera indica TaxID=29780 RepID=UPI001CFB8903|nr:uncharacterized protein LOC123218056 isoform X2 [Mangifera indica]